MIEKIIIKENSQLKKIINYKEIQLKNLTILVGPNGIGKSSIVQGIYNKLKGHTSFYYRSCGESMDLVMSNKEHLYEAIIGRSDNGKYRGYFSDNIELDYITINQSEGQSMMTVFFDKIVQIIERLSKNETDLVLLIDELDSGLSFDNVLHVISIIENIQAKYPNVQIIMTAHNYEFFRVFKDNTFCIDFGQYVDLSEYKNYRAYYMTHIAYQEQKLKK